MRKGAQEDGALLLVYNILKAPLLLILYSILVIWFEGTRGIAK